MKELDYGPILRRPGTHTSGNWERHSRKVRNSSGEESASNDGIHHRNASLRFTASAADAGRLHRVALTADELQATRRLFGRCMCPRRLLNNRFQISEYLANPTSFQRAVI